MPIMLFILILGTLVFGVILCTISVSDGDERGIVAGLFLGLCMIAFIIAAYVIEHNIASIQDKSYKIHNADSPHVPNVQLQYDKIVGDTIYFNWYPKDTIK